MYGYKTYAIITNAQNTLDIIRFGDITEKLAVDLADSTACGRFVGERGGFLGLRKEHVFLGWYREAFVPCPGYEEPHEEEQEHHRSSNQLVSAFFPRALQGRARQLARYDEDLDGPESGASLDLIHDVWVYGHCFLGLYPKQANWLVDLENKECRQREQRQYHGQRVERSERIVTYEGHEVGLWWHAIRYGRHVLEYDVDPALLQRVMPIEDEQRLVKAIAWSVERYGPNDPEMPINRWMARQAKKAAEEAEETR
jgi:hypothetical protein